MQHDTSTWLGGLDSWLDRALIDTKAHASTRAYLQQPDRVVGFRIPIRTDTGTEFLPAWRVLDDTLLGPGKGGIRLSRHANEQEVRSLARGMTIKCAVAHLPFGGGKGAICADRADLSDSQLAQAWRGYGRIAAPFIGPDTDIPAPDMNSGSQEMAWLVDGYSQATGYTEPGVVTGKPEVLGGSERRTGATGLGGAIVLDLWWKRHGADLEKTVAIQGFGKAGQGVARALADRGYTIVAVSDSSATVVDYDGIALDSLISHKTSGAPLSSYGAGRQHRSDYVLKTQAAIAVLAAREQMVDTRNADTVTSTVLLELANGPITHAADDTLTRGGTVILPDVLANSGGVIASWVEWIGNRTGRAVPTAEAEALITETLRAATERVLNRAARDNVSLRRAAWAEAVVRLDHAARLKS